MILREARPALAVGVVREPRVLPSGAEVMVVRGEPVGPLSVVARIPLPVEPREIDVPAILGVAPSDVERCMVRGVGERVATGDTIAVSRGLMGLIVYAARSPVAGTIVDVSTCSGVVLIEPDRQFLEVTAGLEGTVVDVWPDRGAVIEAAGVIVEGVYASGGAAFGRMALQDGDSGDHHGGILLSRSLECGSDGPVSGGLRPAGIVAWAARHAAVSNLPGDFPVLVLRGFGDSYSRDAGLLFAEWLDAMKRNVADGPWPDGMPAGVNGAGFPSRLFIGCRTHGGSGLSSMPACPVRRLDFPQEVLVTGGPWAGALGEVIEFLSSTRARVRIRGGPVITVYAQNLEVTRPPSEGRKHDPQP